MRGKQLLQEKLVEFSESNQPKNNKKFKYHRLTVLLTLFLIDQSECRHVAIGVDLNNPD